MTTTDATDNFADFRSAVLLRTAVLLLGDRDPA